MTRFNAPLNARYATGLIVALGLLLALPNLWLGFFSDDFTMLTAFEGDPIFHRAWYDLYRFTPATSNPLWVAAGAAPWWSSPTLHIHLLRPLSSALLALDYRLFGRWAPGYHLHSLVWLLLYLVSARALFNSILSKSTARLALLILALSASLATPVGWPSARHLLVSGAFCGLGLSIRAAKSQTTYRRILVPVTIALALLAGEAGIGGLAFWLCYELLGPKQSVRITACLRRLLVPLLVTVTYFALYKWANGGVRGSAVYVEPLSAPIEFVKLALVRVPVLLEDMAFGIPSEISTLSSKASVALAAAGVVGISLVALPCILCWSRVSDQERGALRWLIPGATLAMVSTCGGFPGTRLLVVPLLGFAPLLAIAIRLGWNEVLANSGTTRTLRVTSGLLATLHFGLAPLAALNDEYNRHKMASGTQTAVNEAVAASTTARRYLILSASDPMIWMYAGMQMLVDRPGLVQGWCVISATKADLEVKRVGLRELIVEPRGTEFLTGAFERLFRADNFAFHTGESIQQCGVKIRLLALSRGRPKRISVEFEDDPNAQDVVMLAWRDGKLQRVDFDDIGNGTTINWSPGPMKAF